MLLESADRPEQQASRNSLKEMHLTVHQETTLTGHLLTWFVVVVLAGGAFSAVRMYERWSLPLHDKLSQAVTERYGAPLENAGVTRLEPGTRRLTLGGHEFGTVHYTEGESERQVDFGMASCCGLQDRYRLEIGPEDGRVRVYFRQEEGDEYAETLQGISADVERALARVEEERRREQSWR